MKEENKLKIRVKSKTEQRMMEDLELEMISEWDVKKIAITLCCLLLLIIVASYYLFFSENTINEVNSSVVNKDSIKSVILQKKEVKVVAFPELITKEQAPVVVKEKEIPMVLSNKQEVNSKKSDLDDIQYNQYIKRGLLAKRTINKEPSGEINLPLVVNQEKAVSLTYFTEIVNMKGHTAYHEWLMEDKVIFRKGFNILGDRWRVSTRKLFSYTAAGQWQARVITKKDDILHKIDFIVRK